MTIATMPSRGGPLDQLATSSGARGATELRERLASLGRWGKADRVECEAELALLPKGARVVQQAAHHLLDLRGKHLRPVCVALASRFGDGFTPRTRGLAVAVELVHTATLLHDDVVDLAERRRGQPAACGVYGNAASIFAGDWLLVAALRRIAACGYDGLLDKMLAVLDEMLMAESLPLVRRGRVVAERAEYFRIVEGKTAALFRWAMIAGGRAAGLDAACEAALEQYGLHLGVAFQAVDDELAFADTGTGKEDLASESARACSGATVGGLDPSPGMLAVAQHKLEKRGLLDRVKLVEGDAQVLPQGNCEMDAATIAFGIRNVPDRPKALRELARVVRAGGKLAVLELGEPRKGPR